ncbi:DUF3467 domain-containing protein [bacterium]|nr:DUF3467 domain-containing protein [bacterium]
MNDDYPTDDFAPEPRDNSSDDEHSDIQSQQIQHSQVGALVPDKVARGTFSTGAVVLNGTHEFVVDFLLRMTKPHQVAARVVLPPQVVPRMIHALEENLNNYRSRFGDPKLPEAAQPKPEQKNQQQQVNAQELYEQLKWGQTDMHGTYANAVMIGHTPTEFSFDFITTFFPKSVVSNRVFLSAPNVPRLLESLKHSWNQYQQKLHEAQNPPPPPEGPDSFDTTQF